MKTVVVLSLPRSGSSLLAGVLHRLGVDMGSNKGLENYKFLNKFGCYENQDFLRLNHNILARAGHLGFGWYDIPDDARVEKVVKNSESFIKKIIKQNESSLWGWKDTLTIYTIPYIHKYLNNPYYVYLKRDVDSIVNSEIRSVNLLNSFSYFKRIISFFSPRLIPSLFWRVFKFFLRNPLFFRNHKLMRRITVDGYERINNFVKNKNYLVVSFDDLINDSRNVAEELSIFLSINPSEEEVNHALSFVHPELVHFQNT